MIQFFPSTIRQVDQAVGFVFEINTANTSTGSTTNVQFKLPLVTDGTYNFDVDWGDSTSDNITVWNQAETTHTYGSSGTYTITISGDIRGWVFGGTGDRLKILDIQNWGDLRFLTQTATFGGVFRLCSNLDISATDAPIFDTSMQQIGFFEGCSNLVAANNIENWDVSNITVMAKFFQSATNFNKNIGAWNVSNVVTMTSMFQSATQFNNGGSSDINNWNVSNVTLMNFMFFGATNFNQNISGWNVGNVTTMQGMFLNASNFNQPIGSWNVGNVTVFGTVNNGMFRSANAFNQDISDWNVSKAASFTSFMQLKTAANYSAANLDLIYQKWSLLTFVNTGLTIDFNTIKYTAAGQAGRDILTDAPNNWTITDGGI